MATTSWTPFVSPVNVKADKKQMMEWDWLLRAYVIASLFSVSFRLLRGSLRHFHHARKNYPSDGRGHETLARQAYWGAELPLQMYFGPLRLYDEMKFSPNRIFWRCRAADLFQCLWLLFVLFVSMRLRTFPSRPRRMYVVVLVRLSYSPSLVQGKAASSDIRWRLSDMVHGTLATERMSNVLNTTCLTSEALNLYDCDHR